MSASWCRVVSTPNANVRMLLVAPDSMPLVQAIRLAPLHMGLTIVRPDNLDKALADTSFDLVLSDQMSVLLRAEDLLPTARRIWVLGGAPVSRADWSCPHHLLQWTANLSDLTAVIDSCLDGAGVPDLALPKDHGGELPNMPAEGVELLNLLDRPDTSVREVKEVMQRDAVMVAKVLRFVNSPYFNLPRRVASLDHAIALLGFAKLRSAVLATACFGSVEGVAPHHIARVSQRGLKAMRLLRRIAGAHAESAVTAAILMDIGMLLMMRTDSDYPLLVEASLQNGVPLVEAEQAHYGFTHAYMGARLLHHWQLPDDIVNAVAYSHTGYALPSRPNSPRMLLFLVSAMIDAHEMDRPLDLHPQWLEQTGWAGAIDEWQNYLADIGILAVAS